MNPAGIKPLLRTTLRHAAAGFGLLILTMTAVTGAEPATASGSESALSLTEQIIAEEGPKTLRVIGLTRVAVSHPQILTARLSTVLSRQPEAFDCVATCDHIGPLFQVEAGAGSAQLSAGFARVIGDRRRNGFFLSDVYLGFGVKAALLRTFGNTTQRHRNRTYIGAEGEFTITNFNFTLGVFRRVSDESSDDRWLTVLGVGWGF